MISQVFQSIWLAVAIAISGSVLVSARAEDSEKDLPARAAALKDTKVKLEDGLKASEREGKPISAKFEIEDGRLQLSVYTMMADGFTEVVIDPKTGAIAKAENITDAEDLEAAAAQKAAMEKATISLLAAARKAVVANAGYQAVSIAPKMKEGHPTADITLLQGETIKNITEKLD
jgi:hypothetical protein